MRFLSCIEILIMRSRPKDAMVAMVAAVAIGTKHNDNNDKEIVKESVRRSVKLNKGQEQVTISGTSIFVSPCFCPKF